MKLVVKILTYVFWAGFLGSLVFLMGFINDKNGDLEVQSIEITISRQENIALLTEEDIMAMIGNRNNELVGKPFSSISLEHLEGIIRKNPYVIHVNAYSRLPGNLYIDVVQRTPLVRVVNVRYDEYYISTDGFLMPLNPEVIVHSLVAGGMIQDTLGHHVALRKYESASTDQPSSFSTLETIYNIAHHIRKNKFLLAQTEQIYVNEEQEIELIPKVGNHLIIFGNLEDMENKFSKLLAFYYEGIRYSGWEKYSTINLKFRKQIVCTK